MTDTKPMTGQPPKDLGESKKNQKNSGPEIVAWAAVGSDGERLIAVMQTRDDLTEHWPHLVRQRPLVFGGPVSLAPPLNEGTNPEREARAAGGVGDERNGRKENAPRAEQAEGWVLVPREPTKEMLEAARDWSLEKYGLGIGNDGATGCYRAMLAAAPALKPGEAALAFCGCGQPLLYKPGAECPRCGAVQ